VQSSLGKEQPAERGFREGQRRTLQYA
jgi:hypothetical protein